MDASFSAELVGRRCSRFHVIVQTFDGAVRNPYYSLYIATDDGASFCVNLDEDMLFWRSELPRALPGNGHTSYRLVELEELRSLAGSRVRSVNFQPASDGSWQLVVRFQGGGKLRYWDEGRSRNLAVDVAGDT